jgi:porphobilinogen synthase
MQSYPDVRLRRLRRTPGLRAMFADPAPGPEHFLWPVFVIEGQRARTPIESLPGQERVSIDLLAAHVQPVLEQGVGGVLLFGVLDTHKTPAGSYAWRDDGLVQNAVRALRSTFPDIVIFTDVCLCGYTDHGHCGPLAPDGRVDNDSAVRSLGKAAVSHAAAGADGVAPSAMMDGQVAGIRQALGEANFHDTLLMSYSTKFASALYGPFREAAHSAPGRGDRRGYQAPADDPRQALRESLLDDEEGADILMVKPALYYLDIIADVRAATDLPLAAYNVSGEYAMVCAAAERGWGDRNALAREGLTAIRRAGADILISYWASDYAAIFGRETTSE